MADLVKDLENWFKDRPKWLQDATRRLLEKGELVETDFDELLMICGSEAEVEFEGEEIPEVKPIPEGAFLQEEHAHKVEICSISNIVGINALNPRKPLEVPTGLTIVYGQNGSGKSGYTRLLKQVCGAKNSSPLHPNAFDVPPAGQTCDIKYKYDDNEAEINWDAKQGINEQLSAVEIYDSECGSVYVVNENQLAYEPALLRLFTELTEASDKLSNQLDGLARELVTAKPRIPDEYADTKFGQWYGGVSSKTTVGVIEANCTWGEVNQKALATINDRLKSSNPKANAEVIRKHKKSVDKLLAGFRTWQPKLGAEGAASYLATKKDFTSKQVAASTYAKSIFENSPLEGIGDVAWSMLWEQARAYSENVAYAEAKFPNVSDDAVCVLCQQPLEDKAKKRLTDFEGFVRSELESAAKTAKETLDAAEVELKKTPDEEIITTLIAAADLEDDMANKLIALREEIKQQSEELISTEVDKEFNIITDFSVVDLLVRLSEDMEVTAKQFDEDAKTDKTEQLRKEATELETKKWLSQQKEAILAEVLLQGKRVKVADAKLLVNTSALTRKKTALSEELISAEYIKRFEEEVKSLGAGRVKVKLEKTRSDKGRIFFQIKLERNYLDLPVDHILSEGEFRIVSLAAFLADVEGHADKSTFIFDDPISSLDQDYEENVCARLALMAIERQVIVFTHRLSMLALLEVASEKAGNSRNIIGLKRQPWGSGEPVDTPIFAQQTTKALNTLLDRTASAKKIFEDKGWDDYEMIGKGIASQVRIVLEKIVEKDLLADVVSRFRRDIHTKNKLDKVSKITGDDCKLIDDYMTKYSRFEHSQPDELPVPPPEPDELLIDIVTIKEWLEEFKKR